MRRMLRLTLLTIGLAAAAGDLAAAPPVGSQLPPDENACEMCHGEADLWEKDTLHLYIAADKLAEDVHWQKGVNCHDCHGGDPSTFDPGRLHAAEDGFRALADIRQACDKCHPDQAVGLTEGVHAEAGEKDARGWPAPLACVDCHGDVSHALFPAGDSRSPVFLNHQVRRCGQCHQEALDQYTESVHGHGLYRAGLVVTAVCADCHDAHVIYPASDERSALYATNVAATCAQCHRFIEERLARSVHGRGNGPGGTTEEPAPGGKIQRTPSCTDCHQGHDLARPTSVRFRLGVANRCGDCHAELFRDYVLSMHGELTELGYGPAAKCADCHGSHEILPVSDPRSTLSPARRLATCRKCHPDAPARFAEFDPHADHRDPKRDPVLFWVYVAFMTFLISMIGFFGLHSALWFVRSAIDVARNGRPKSLVAGGVAYVRFSPFHRIAHTVMVVSFLGLAMTGLPLKYSQYEWAQVLARAMGGFASTGLWHRFFGLVNIGCLVVYVMRMVLALGFGGGRRGSRWGVLFGPDSPVPAWRDLKAFGKMLRWFVGRGPKPTFDRWAYWEKIDFWGACADIVIIGLTGLILWFPNFVCRLLPGETLNIAKVIHSTQALLATGFVFAIHFFATHIRPEKFPMDMSVLTGLVSEDELREERPRYYERLRQDNRLDAMRGTAPSATRLWLIRLGGFLALAVGLGLLAGMVFAALAR